MLYGQQIRLPGEFLSSSTNATNFGTQATFVQALREHMRQILPIEGSRHGSKKVFVFKDLLTTDFVFLRHDGPKAPLQPPYEGPFKVISRTAKTFLLNINNRNVTVSLDRLKLAYVMGDVKREEDENDEDDQREVVFYRAQDLVHVPEPEIVPVPEPIPEQVPAQQQYLHTRSGRQIRFTSLRLVSDLSTTLFVFEKINLRFTYYLNFTYFNNPCHT